MKENRAKKSVTWRNIGWVVFLFGAAVVYALSTPILHREPPMMLACLVGGIVMAFGLFILIAEPPKR